MRLDDLFLESFDVTDGMYLFKMMKIKQQKLVIHIQGDLGLLMYSMTVLKYAHFLTFTQKLH